MFRMIPAEYTFAGIYLPPLFLVIVLGLFSAIAISKLSDVLRIGRFFWQPSLAFAALWAVMTSLIGLLFIAP
jgi:hypothetical protein